MRITLIAGDDHPSTQGGVSTFNRNIMKILAKEELYTIAYKTNNKKIYTEKYKKLLEIYFKNKKIKRIDRKFFNFKIREFLLKKKVKNIEPRICIFNSPNDIEVFNNYNYKKILVQHLNFDNFERVYGKNKEELSKIIKSADKFICLSIYDKIRFIKELDLDEKKVGVIHHTNNIEVRTEKKIRNRTLIMIARLDNQQKRFDLVINSMKKLHEYTLKIYGTGSTSDQNKIEKIILESEVKNVELCGITNEVKEKLDEAGIFIMTSDYEGYPLALIEAMRRGLPIILRDTFDSAKDIINKNGILLKKEWNENEFIEAVKDIYSNYDYYSKNSLEASKKYDFNKIKNEWIKLINELI